ncbi:Uncharacterized protein FWK35_00006134 [Aphis craccivora]|uniref:Uncharacterized protein n=1 Tax=Aphis craccivora TaxID=307492 RepID=A0A6G0ZKV1_APHCR|nr:Uncharacterized protein FWK35_00006134 [Aphis craccivora]
MRFGILSVGALSGRSSRINAATGTAHGEQGRSVRQPARSAPEEPEFARWLRCHNGLTAGPVFCDGTGKRLRAITNHRPRRQRITGHGARGFKRFSESQATVDVATTATINRKISAGGSGDYTTPPPINASAEHKIARPTQGRLAQFGRFCLHNLTVARPTKGSNAQFCYTVKTTKTSTKKIPQVNKIQSTVKVHYKTVTVLNM